MNLPRFLEAYSIPHTVQSRRGWIELQCPHCDDRSQNLGYNVEKDFFSCWRCGGHRVVDTICRLANVTPSAAEQLIRQYSGGPQFAVDETIRIGKKKAFKFPASTNGHLESLHKKYLLSRRFDPDSIVEEWDIMGTGPVAPLDGTDYKHRLVIPIYWQKRVVSFQTRDVTGKHKIRYLACPKQRELVEHQSIVYCHPKCDPDEWVVMVEGVTDAWRLGSQAVATFGISITSDQVRAISTTFRKVVLLFDRETQAQKSARALMGELRFRRTQCRLLSLPVGVKDPAELSDEQVAEILAEIETHSPAF